MQMHTRARHVLVRRGACIVRMHTHAAKGRRTMNLLAFETMETRRLFAITAAFTPGSGLLAVSGDASDNAIVVSRIFDHSRVPRYAVEYLVYHEMLHLKHPVKLRGSRRCVHGPEFQAEEKLFPHLEQALAFLKRL